MYTGHYLHSEWFQNDYWRNIWAVSDPEHKTSKGTPFKKRKVSPLNMLFIFFLNLWQREGMKNRALPAITLTSSSFYVIKHQESSNWHCLISFYKPNSPNQSIQISTDWVLLKQHYIQAHIKLSLCSQAVKETTSFFLPLLNTGCLWVNCPLLHCHLEEMWGKLPWPVSSMLRSLNPASRSQQKTWERGVHPIAARLSAKALLNTIYLHGFCKLPLHEM